MAVLPDGERPVTARNRYRTVHAAGGAGFGYGSESTFSTAFNRFVGEAPQRYRHRVREEAIAAA